MSQSTSQAKKILVFDSGAGGLSIVKETHALRPDLQIVFAADTEFFPYGTRCDDSLTERIILKVGELYSEIQPDLVVVACNTASTLALETLRQRFPCPFVGVVPAIKPAAKLTQSGALGVLATPATVNRSYTSQLIQDFAADKTVVLHGSDSLVSIAETKVCGEQVSQEDIDTAISALFSQPEGELVDTVVLACTHFPLLREELEGWSLAHNKTVTWIDSGHAIARRVDELLPERSEEHHDPLVSVPNPEIQNHYQRWLQMNLEGKTP